MSTAPARTLGAFLNISLDGYYCGVDGSMSFAHKPPDDTEWNEFVSGNASGSGALVFGRITYDMMAAWWPTPMAAQAMPSVATGMNASPKYVCSRTMKSAAWVNTTVIGDDVIGTMRRLKAEPGPNMVILGSGSIITQFADAGLLDTLQVVINPITLGGGKAIMAGLSGRRDWTLTKSRVFGNGSVVLWYAKT